jgi:hypothetical protein
MAATADGGQRADMAFLATGLAMIDACRQATIGQYGYTASGTAGQSHSR